MVWGLVNAFYGYWVLGFEASRFLWLQASFPWKAPTPHHDCRREPLRPKLGNRNGPLAARRLQAKPCQLQLSKFQMTKFTGVSLSN